MDDNGNSTTATPTSIDPDYLWNDLISFRDRRTLITDDPAPRQRQQYGETLVCSSDRNARRRDVEHYARYEHRYYWQESRTDVVPNLHLQSTAPFWDDDGTRSSLQMRQRRRSPTRDAAASPSAGGTNDGTVFHAAFATQPYSSHSPSSSSLINAILNQHPISTIASILRTKPDLTRSTDASGRTPLHIACALSTLSSLGRSSYQSEVLSLLLGVYPQATIMKDDGGYTPLILALLSSNADGAVVTNLVRAEAELLLADDSSTSGSMWTHPQTGANPLHYATSCNSNILSTLVRAYPHAISTSDNNGTSPLLSAIKNGAPVEVVRALVQADVDQVGACNRSGESPLGIALGGNNNHQCGGNDNGINASSDFDYRTDDRVIHTLIASCPSAASVPDPADGVYPLIRSILNGHSIGVVRELIRASGDDSDGTVDSDIVGMLYGGKTPLRLAAELSDENVVRTILVANPSAASMPDDGGQVPLLTVCLRGSGGKKKKENQDENMQDWTAGRIEERLVESREKRKEERVKEKVSVRTVAALLKADPTVASKADKHGSTALHVAIENEASDIILALLKYCPQCASVRTINGISPLWSVLDKGMGVVGSTYLTETSGEGDGRRYARQSSLDVVEALARADPKMVLEPDGDGDTVLHRLLKRCPNPSRGSAEAAALTTNTSAEHERYMSVLLRACPKVAPKQNKEGKTPLHLACIGGSSLTLIGSLLRTTNGGQQLHVPDLCGKSPAYYVYRAAYAATMKRLKRRELVPKLDNCRLASSSAPPPPSSSPPLPPTATEESLQEMTMAESFLLEGATSGDAAATGNQAARLAATLDSDFVNDEVMIDLHARVRLVLMAEALGTVVDEGDGDGESESKTAAPFNVVHAAVESPTCPETILALVLRFNPTHAFEDRHLLHRLAAVTTGSLMSDKTDLNKCDGCGEDAAEGKLGRRYVVDPTSHNGGGGAGGGVGPFGPLLAHFMAAHGAALSTSTERHCQFLCPRCYKTAADPTSGGLHLLGGQEGASVGVGTVNVSLIKELLRVDPGAALLPDPVSGRLPLNIAVESCGGRWHEGVRALFEAAPEVLQVKDLRTRLYPFMLAAVGGTSSGGEGGDVRDDKDAGGGDSSSSTQWERNKKDKEGEEEGRKQITTIFHLLTLDPSLVKGGIV